MSHSCGMVTRAGDEAWERWLPYYGVVTPMVWPCAPMYALHVTCFIASDTDQPKQNEFKALVATRGGRGGHALPNILSWAWFYSSYPT